MFIEKLWEENPELVIKAVKNVWDIKENRGDTLEFIGINNSELRFQKYSRYSYYSHSIIIRDFEVYDDKVNSNCNIDWMKFMYNQFGDMYVYQYIGHRNCELDRFMAKYEEEFNDKTMKVIKQLGFEMGKTK